MCLLLSIRRAVSDCTRHLFFQKDSRVAYPAACLIRRSIAGSGTAAARTGLAKKPGIFRKGSTSNRSHTAYWVNRASRKSALSRKDKRRNLEQADKIRIVFLSVQTPKSPKIFHNGRKQSFLYHSQLFLCIFQ